MRDILAERLLARVMKWTPEDVARERPILQALAAIKYDEYQQFSPGMRFVESLARWLAQFDSSEDRQTAYEFVRSKLIFVSNAEMLHLIAISFPDLMRPMLIGRLASTLQRPQHQVVEIARSTEYQVLLRQCMFLGLSDGARTDYFRRANPELSHEQVWQTYEIPEQKAEDMLSKLAADLQARLGRPPTEPESKFRWLFLLDDFSGSGLSYLRRDDHDGYSGKIHKVLTNILQGDMSPLFDLGEIQVAVILYVATQQALSHIQTIVQQWLAANSINIECVVLAAQELPVESCLSEGTDSALISMSQRYFDDAIITNSYAKGKHTQPYLGFDECGLPLVLAHNTPNNSIPLLWFEEDRDVRGLFPRVSRHKS